MSNSKLSPPKTGVIGVTQTRRKRSLTPTGWVAVVFIMICLIVGFVVPLFYSADGQAQDLGSAFIKPFTDSAHIFGTDQLGRDLLARMSVATRVSIYIAVGSVIISVVLGIVLGLISGYVGKRVDGFIMSFGDITLAIPTMLMLIVVAATIGSSIPILMLFIGLLNWVIFGRLVRSIVLSVKNREFITAAVSAGASDFRIISKHLLSFVIPELLVTAGYQLGIAVSLESSLSYLGLGVQPPTPSLGLLVADGQQLLQQYPYMTILPATIIFLLIAGVQFLSQGFKTSKHN